ncbi:2-ketogluconate reductase [Methylobacterium adhaesivum]|jgi:lactate dehydrogenase-like 2-hydroxyacid dehydrogenase|uniref:2-hydroxyacid dehydrogenase n=1 Tax=Methylobacterium adhaesivum TaxID=333297 RepID=A0ABT8BC04_9HYPH|nr:2-hydroxyacid dehydrogenase [Methylobacterium adhaesivum]MDN3589578.1 2-hydroxyacid dehydrogenase [Methylobacterium adhaesivum]GJD30595.1 2-ketogluconate reductase [Methylobacterium adhaesivum]
MPPVDLLLLKPMQPSVMEALAERFTLHRADTAPDLEAFYAEVGPRIRAMATGAQAPVDAALLARLPNLEIVASFGVGYDTIDTATAAARGVVVTNTPDVLSDEVADLTLGLLLATLRQIPQADRYLRAGHWPTKPYPLTPTLRGRTVGILGLGRIGRAIATRLEGFGVQIAYHGRRRQADVRYAYHASLLDMARAVDVLVVVAPGGPETDGLVDAGVLAALGPQGILVNVARGSVVDEEALVAALKAGTILGAGLDVFAREPHVPADLVAMDHVVLLPHVGSGSVHTREAMGRLVVDNLIHWFSGRGPLTPVPETPWSGRT